MFKTVDYAQALDLTVRLGDCLPLNHLARFVVDSVALLDLSALYAEYDTVGEFGFHAQNTANSSSKRAWLLNSPTVSIIGMVSDKTPQNFVNCMPARAGIEGTLSQGIRGFGLRHCRSIGLSKAHLQHIFTAIAMNVVRSVAWVKEVPQAKTRTSRFAALRVCGA